MTTKAQNMRKAKSVRRELRLRSRYLKRLDAENDYIDRQMAKRKELIDSLNEMQSERHKVVSPAGAEE